MGERDDELGRALAEVVGAERVEGLVRLSGGASRETWAFDAVDGGGSRPLILQRERAGGVRKAGMATEAALLRAAGQRGVPAPEVVATDADHLEATGLGHAWVVVARLEGETIPRRILRDDDYAEARPRLAPQCGTALAGIHAIPLDDVAGLDQPEQLSQYRDLLDELGEPHPAFELGFRWLEANRPPSARTTVVHGDFRNGNLMIGPDGLRAVLDWELAHLGDPVEDLGWLCVRSWRFGAEPRVGGFGTVDDLVEAYETASGTTVDRGALAWWEALGTLKWGIMCIVQAATHRSGAVRSVELAAIGRRVCEVEHDLLLLLP
ncbi:MAG TPA: phosphotransferase family protein [Acidimicrobiales bacterium]|nr:phosphotransferase family protein [Acidimicrobiales bacterium]